MLGLDVHKDTIAVTVAKAGRDAPESRGTVANTPLLVNNLVKRFGQEFSSEQLLLCYNVYYYMAMPDVLLELSQD